MKAYAVFDNQTTNLNLFESIDMANGFALDRVTYLNDERFWIEANGGDFSPWGEEMKLVLAMGSRHIFVREVEVVPSL